MQKSMPEVGRNMAYLHICEQPGTLSVYPIYIQAGGSLLLALKLCPKTSLIIGACTACRLKVLERANECALELLSKCDIWELITNIPVSLLFGWDNSEVCSSRSPSNCMYLSPQK